MTSGGNDQPDAADGIIRFDGVSKSFGHLRVLKRVTFDLPKGSTSVIMGPSGTGKSVTLKLMIGLLRPDHGEVWYGDQRIDSLAESRLTDVRKEFGFLFQQGALFDSMTVEDNVAFPLVEHTNQTKQQRRNRVEQVLDLVGLHDVLDRMPAELSGGQRKRVALARAVVLEPSVVLYDEPTTGLDPIRADLINELIIRLRTAMNITSVVVTHDLVSAFKVADRMLLLYDGRIVMSGMPGQFRASDNDVVRRFLEGEAATEDLDAIQASVGNSGSANGQPD